MQHFPSDIAADPIALAPASARLRRLGAADEGIFRDHLVRLDAASRRLRFGSPVNDLFLARHARSALQSRAVLFGAFEDGTLIGVAEIHADASGDLAEAAFSVEPAYRSLGLGTRLFRAVLDAVRNRGVSRLVLSCLAENVRMRRIASRHGAELKVAAGEIVAEILNPHPDAGTLAREWGAEIAAIA